MKPRSGEYTHLIRMAGLFAVGIAAFLLVRWLLVPADFGQLGHYRTGAVADNMQRPVKFAGQAACVECHTDVAELRAKGKHAAVSCESCHGALAAHAQNPDGARPVRPDTRKTCIVCHTAGISKPKTFPQVVPAEHAPEGPCSECHVVHNPKIS
jgi:uncharacterized CHY-type Zn-finger protein